MTATRVARSRESSTAPLDVAGAVSVGAVVVLLVVAGMQGPDWGWLSPGTLVVLAGAALALTLSVVTQRRAIEPILPLGALRDPNFVGAAAINSLVNLCLSAMLFLGPLFLENVLDESPGATGVLLFALTGTLVIFSTAGGRLIGAISGRQLLIVASGLVAVGALVSASIGEAWTYAELVPGWVLAGAGIGLVGSVSLNVALARVPAAIAACSSGVFTALALLGGTFGVTLASGLFDGFSGETNPTAGDAVAIAEGISGSLYVTAGLAAVALVLAVVLLNRRPETGQIRDATEPPGGAQRG